MATKVMSRTFQKAADVVGGPRTLARRLRVPLAELENWIAGGGQPPMAIFLKAVDLVLAEAPHPPPPPASEPGEEPKAHECAAGGTPYAA